MIHRIPILSLLMQDDRLAHLYITGFIEYIRGKTVHCMRHMIRFPILSLMNSDQLAHLHIKGFIEYKKGLKVHCLIHIRPFPPNSR
jgi:hypothetical protein